jgi:hypothetical protein
VYVSNYSSFSMPQLDLYSVFNQLVWGSFFFVVFYYLVVFVFVPTFFSSLYARQTFSTGRSGELLELTTLIFVTHFFLATSVEAIEDALGQLADQLIYSRVVNLAVYETAFEFEFAQLFEEENESIE